MKPSLKKRVKAIESIRITPEKRDRVVVYDPTIGPPDLPDDGKIWIMLPDNGRSIQIS